MERLQKYIAGCGICSRRKAAAFIEEGKVRVNGKIVKQPWYRINPQEDIIKVDEKKIKQPQLIYIKLNKPADYLTSLSDPHHKKCITDLITDIDERIYPVGRLDKDTEGLLLLTNDGEMANKLLHPRYKVDKKYEVVIDGNLKKHEEEKFRKGIEIDEKKTLPCKIQKIQESKYQVVLKEGRKRQIKLMFANLGYKVCKLKRTEFGPLKLGKLKPGEYKALTKEEKETLNT